MAMKPYTIRPNNLTEQVIDELIEKYGCSKVGAFDLLAEKFVQYSNHRPNKKVRLSGMLKIMWNSCERKKYFTILSSRLISNE